MGTITPLPTKELDIVDTLRRMADGRLLLNVRRGVATPAGLLAKAADEIERLRTALRAIEATNPDELHGFDAAWVEAHGIASKANQHR